MQAVRLLATVLLGLSFALAASRQDQRTLTSAAGGAAFVVLALLLAVEALWDMPLNRAFGGVGVALTTEES